MGPIPLLLIALAGLVAVALLARREARAARARRAGLLDACRPLFAESRLEHDEAGFPSLLGHVGPVETRLRLVPDTLTVRRLPQLWLVLTQQAPLAAGGGFSVLARPAGTEFYALSDRFGTRLDPPEGLPSECLARGEDDAQAALYRAGPALAHLLADGRVKEVAATERRLRLVVQLAEGQRGAHLLLRQCVFDDAALAPGRLAALLDAMAALRGALHPAEQADPVLRQAS